MCSRSIGVALSLLSLFLFGVACGPAADPASGPASGPAGAKADGDDGDAEQWPVEGGGGRDAAGHPVGAAVFEAETLCFPAVGSPVGLERWRVRPGVDAAGLLCAGTVANVGRGRFIVNLRAATAAPHACRFDSWPADQPCPEGQPVVEIVAYDDASGEQLGSHTVRDTDYWTPLTDEDRSLTFDVQQAGPVRIELHWHGSVPLRFDYLELFRPDHQLVLDPPSGALSVIGEQAPLRIQLERFSGPQQVSVSCDGADRTAVLEQLIASGEATDEQTDFRRVIEVPFSSLLADCPRPTLLRVTATQGLKKFTRRMTVRDTPPACDWHTADAASGGDATGKVKVLLTGFEPFPAASTGANASGEAVRAVTLAELDEDLRDRLALMRVVIPVEWDTAPGWIEEMIVRCQPDVVISFGQGGGLDIETTAYNLKDASTRSWQVDNRGLIHAGTPIVAGGPSKRITALPAEEIVAALHAAGYPGAETSTDPGRYICNNTFYYTSHVAEQLAAATPPRRVDVGFVHLPPDRNVSDADRAKLAEIVGTIVSVAARPRLADLPAPSPADDTSND